MNIIEHWINGSYVPAARARPRFIATLADRASDLERFAYRRGPVWPFLVFSSLHVAALAALGAALSRAPVKRWE